MKFTPRDIGIAIRENMYDSPIKHIEDGDYELVAALAWVDHVDVSDPAKPVLHVGQQKFALTITEL